MTNVTIPATIDDVGTRLASLDALVRSSEWERAAIVWAFTTKGKAGRPSKDAGNLPENREIYSVLRFARFGFSGLKHQDTVRHYRKTWQAVIEAGQASPAVPGQKVSLPDLDWKIATQASPAEFATIEAVGKAIKANPGIAAEQIAEAITTMPEVAEAVNKNKKVKAAVVMNNINKYAGGKAEGKALVANVMNKKAAEIAKSQTPAARRRHMEIMLTKTAVQVKALINAAFAIDLDQLADDDIELAREYIDRFVNQMIMLRDRFNGVSTAEVEAALAAAAANGEPIDWDADLKRLNDSGGDAAVK